LKHQISQIKDEFVRRHLLDLYQLENFDEIYEVLKSHQENGDHYGSIHPAFMGGQYLPDIEENELEIARLMIRSVTYDITALYARFDKGKIHYRMADEYEGETLVEPTRLVSDKPLSLGEMRGFFLSSYSLIECLEWNDFFWGNGRTEALDFFEASSNFYPDFHESCVSVVEQKFDEIMRLQTQ